MARPGDPRQPAGLRDDGPGYHRGAEATADLHAASADARRTRRTGDVRCTASSVRRSSWPAYATSARLRPSRSPIRRWTGSPPGAPRRICPRRRLMQWGVAGAASIYAAHELGWEQVWESVAAAAEAPQKTCVVLLYLAGGNDGLNILLPSGGEDYQAYADARPTIHRGQGANAGGRVGSWQLPGPGAALAFANVAVSGADNNGG